VEKGLLSEDSPLREVLYPYRANTKCTEDLNYFYEKILVEREVLSRVDLPGTVLRLPKVYGPGRNQNLETVYSYKNRPNWRWTHGYVENVAAAITLAALHPAARGRVYNVGEMYTPTVQERLEAMPPSTIQPFETGSYNFDQNIAYDTTRIRTELGFEETVSFAEGLRSTFAQGSTPTF
jgi:nucleoside-diphosphate-sugar epimerase